MSNSSPKLTWCVAALSNDLNWWVVETSDPIHWDSEGLSIIDPRQVAHILDLLEPLRDYGLQNDVVETAFFPFAVEQALPDKRLRLVRTTNGVADTEEPLFWLPDSLDEDKSPYADFLDHITKVRVKMLNAVFDFEQRLTVDDLEDEIREDHHNAFLEGRTVHAFREVCDILEYVPQGYELDETEEAPAKDGDADVEVIPEIVDELPEEEDVSSLEKDASMKWDEDEEEEKEETEEEEYIPPLEPKEGDDTLFADEHKKTTASKKKKAASSEKKPASKKKAPDKAPAKKTPPKKAPAKKRR